MNTNIINKENPIPIYTQIANWIRSNIKNKIWEIDYQLPSEEDFAKELGVSRGTFRKAVSSLIKEGLLVQIQGKGTFVSGPVVSFQFASELISFAETMDKQNIDFVTQVIEAKIIEPPIEVKKQFKLDTLEKVFYLKRCRLIENKPIILLENFINLEICPDIEKYDYSITPLFSAIEQSTNQRINYGIRKFDAKSITSEQAELLNLEIGLPILYLNQVTYLNYTQPVEVSNMWLKSDQYNVISYLNR